MVWDCKQLGQIYKHVSYKLLNSTDTMHDAIKPRTTDSINWYLSNKQHAIRVWTWHYMYTPNR